MLLQPLLVLAAQIDLEDDTIDLRTLFPKASLDLEIRSKEVGVVLQFPLATHAGMELLPVIVIAVAPMRVEHVPPAVGQGIAALVCVDLNGMDQALVAKVVKAVLGVAKVLRVPLADDAKRAYGGEHPTVIPIQLIQAFTVVLHQLALGATWQVQAVQEWVARITFSRIQISVPFGTVTRVLTPARFVDSVVTFA